MIKLYLKSSSDENKPLYRRLAILYSNIAAVYEDMGQTADAAAYALTAYRIVIEKELDMGDFQKLLQRMERLNTFCRNMPMDCAIFARLMTLNTLLT